MKIVNFFSVFLRVIKEAFLVIVNFFVKLYEVFIGFLYRYLPTDVAKILLIMLAVIIVGVLISYFLRNNVK